MDSAIRGTEAITAAIRITRTRMQPRIMIPIIRTRITPIRMPTALRHSSTLLSNSSTVRRHSSSTIRRNNSNSTLLRRTLLSSNTVKGLRPRNKPRRSRTRLLAMLRHRRRNPVPTPARMASGTVLAKSLLNKTPSKTARLHAASPVGAALLH